MKIKSPKNKKPIDIFYKTYFFITLIIFVITWLVLINLQVWQKNKNDFTKKIYLNGISNYQYLPKIFYLVLKHSFSKLENFNLEIDGGTAFWNGKNLRNKQVSSGVYIIMLSDLQSYETKILKLMIIR